MRILVASLLLAAGCSSLGHSSGGSSDVPATFVRSTADAQVARTIEVREGLSHATAMRLLSESLSQKYTVDVSDARAGFVMTAWQAPMREGAPDLRYRTRIIARFLGEDWKRLQVRNEANWARADEWDVGYDAPQLESITQELRAKLGRKP